MLAAGDMNGVFRLPLTTAQMHRMCGNTVIGILGDRWYT